MSSCSHGAPHRPVALHSRVCLHARDIIESLLPLLKSPSVDVEDFDRVVGAGAGKLDPETLVLGFILFFCPSTRPALLTCSPGPGPPAQGLHCQSVALAVRRYGSGKRPDFHHDDKKGLYLIHHMTPCVSNNLM